MFRLFKTKCEQTELVNSKLFDEKTFYRQFVKDINKSSHSILIESPFLTEKRATYLSEYFSKAVSRGVKVTIYTRDPGHHDRLLRQQAWKAVSLLKSSGATVIAASDMRHRKLAVIDESILWEGSLNILSQATSRELMRRTESEALASDLLKFINVDNR